MADVYSIVFFLFGLLVAVCGLNVWIALVFPQPVRRCRDRLERTPMRSFVLGVIYFVVLGFAPIAMMGGENPTPLRLLGLGLIAPLMVGLTVGGAGLATLVGERVGEMQRGVSPFALLVRGSLVSFLSALVPVVGWFVFIPIAWLTMLGAGLTAMILRSGPAQRTSAPPRVPVPAPAS